MTGAQATPPQSSDNELAALIGPSWSADKTRQALGLSNQRELAERRAAGDLLGVTTADGDTLFPVDQFHRLSDGRVEVKPALVPFLRTLRRFDPWAVAVLVHTPAPELDNQTPLDWLRHGGEAQPVADLAHAVAREWNAGTQR